MFSIVKKVFGGIVAIFVVLFIIGACFGESDEGSSDYIAWWKRFCTECVLFEKQELETPNPICDAGGGVRVKISPMTLRIYKAKNEFVPQSEWNFSYATSDLTFTALLPDGIEKARIEVDRRNYYGGFLKGSVFNSPAFNNPHIIINNKEVVRYIGMLSDHKRIDTLKSVSIWVNNKECEFKFE